MRKAVVIVSLILMLAALAPAQDYVHSTFGSEPLELGAWGGYGNGVGKAGDWRFAEAGARFGKVLTGEIGSGCLRGNFEFSGDAIPLFLVRQPEIVLLSPNNFVRTGRTKTIYGGGINPIVMKWNFTRGKRIAPFAGIDGGALFTSQDMPEPDTSTTNFVSGAEFGAHFFRSDKRAITLSGHVLHISNASIGNHNPGLNTTFHFRLGYTWFK
jgi:lipid A 3-O-deacylase